jgi:hypothetical protein
VVSQSLGLPLKGPSDQIRFTQKWYSWISLGCHATLDYKIWRKKLVLLGILILKWAILNTYQSLLFRKATSVGTSCFSDVSASTFRPLIPLSFRKTIFEHDHFLGHPGIRATRRLISSWFLWQSMAQNVNQWTRQCLSYLKSKSLFSPSSLIPLPFPFIPADLPVST